MTYLELKFCYYTECQLATLATLQFRKSTSKSELKRQQDIANGMCAVCQTFEKINWFETKTPRLEKLIKS